MGGWSYVGPWVVPCNQINGSVFGCDGVTRVSDSGRSMIVPPFKNPSSSLRFEVAVKW